MAEQRRGFRFRLPWLSAAPAPAPRPRPPPPVPRRVTQAPSQPPTTTATPAQRPPFRPPGSAPPQAQAQRTESPSSTPSSASGRSQVSSQPASPARTTAQSRAASQPPSPSGSATKSRVASQRPSPSGASTPSSRSGTEPPSPSRATAKSQPAGQPTSPSLTASENEPGSQAVPQPQSPPKLASQPEVQTSSMPSSLAANQPTLPSEKLQSTTERESQPPPLSVSREKTEPTRSQPLSQELQPKAKITSGNIMNTENQTPTQMNFQPSRVQAHPLEPTASEAEIAPASTKAEERSAHNQKTDSPLVRAEPEPLPVSEKIPEETPEGKETVQELGDKQNINGVIEEQQQKNGSQLPSVALGSKSPRKMHPSDAFKTEQKQPDKEEIQIKKETFAMSGKQSKTLISNLRDKSTVGDSRHKTTISGMEQASLHKEISDDISKFVHKMANQQPKLAMDEKPVSVITLAGENRGASLQLGSEAAKEGAPVHIRRGYKINPDETPEAANDAEGSSEGRSSKSEDDQESKTYINSNVQGLNNSIVFNGSITERDPGVQLVLSRNLPETTKTGRRTDSAEAHKAEFNVTPAQKLTYEPTVRRRCLGGLFMEPSDSDTDNPEKPRRHGCLYGCKEKSKENEIDVL